MRLDSPSSYLHRCHHARARGLARKAGLIRMFSSMLRRCFFPQQQQLQQQQQRLSLRRTWHQGTFELLFRLPNLATVSSCKRVHHCQMSPRPFGELFLWDSKTEKKKSRHGFFLPTRHAALKTAQRLGREQSDKLECCKTTLLSPQVCGFFEAAERMTASISTAALTRGGFSSAPRQPQTPLSSSGDITAVR